jgi:tetratricopeptide (TPR) repeat protein
LLVASFVAGLVSQQFLVFTVPTALAFYTGAALIVAWTIVPIPNPSRVPVAYRRMARVGVLAVSALLLTFGGQLALADRALHWARVRVEERNVLGTLQAYEQVRRVQPWGMNTDIWFAQVMDLLANNAPNVAGRIAAMQVVMEASQRAAERSDERPNALYGIAAFYSASGNYPAAEKAAREAIRIAPHWYKSHLLLSRALSEQGLVERARQEAELAVWLNGGKAPEVQKTFEALP